MSRKFSPSTTRAFLLAAVPALASMLITQVLASNLRGDERYLQDDNVNDNNITDPGDERQFFKRDWYQYFIIPFISGIVGFGTNWVALKMTFYPLEFTPRQCEFVRFEDQPFGLCGWQGIIPTKAGKMARQSCRIMMEKLFDINEIFLRIDQHKAAEAIKPGFGNALERIIDDLSHEFIIDRDTSWKRTEQAVKAQVRQWAVDELPGFTVGFMGDLIKNLDNCYDLEHMVVTEMTNNKSILNDLFITVGAQELRFIERSGFYFGFLFGIVQMIIYGFSEAGYVLPIFGVIVGLATNYIALKMIFEPIEPHFVCGGRFKVHGAFLKRQKQASAVFATKIVSMVLHSKNIWHYMLTGPKHEAFEKILRSHADEFTDRMVGYTRPLVEMWMGAEQFTVMKEKVQDQTIAEIEDIIQYMHDYTDQALDLETEIREKMAALPSAEFEQVLHPVFQEDEAKLIAVGAVLGGLVGLVQMFIF